jgi:glyoxylase-like metal-dependent hydrolase (beta-lactamase superfamily II)
MLFRQLFDAESSTFTYLLADEVSREAILIDPVRETAQRDLEQLSSLGLTLTTTLETHVHADHITGAWALHQRTGSKCGVAGAAHLPCADLQLAPGDIVRCGSFSLEVRATPGHTDSCLSFVLDDHSMAFTGDALLIRGCGRTDFQAGDPRRLYRSVREQIFTLPSSTKLFPAHDYQGRSVTTVQEERSFNPRLHDAISEDDFAAIMAGLKLALPKKMAIAVPANMTCGRDAPTMVAPLGFEGGEGI